MGVLVSRFRGNDAGALFGRTKFTFCEKSPRTLTQSSTAINRHGDAPPFLINRGSTIIFTRFLEI